MSFGELLFLALLALLVFGPEKLPEIARSAAKLMTELRRASNEFRYTLEDEIRSLETVTKADPQLPPAPPGAVAAGADAAHASYLRSPVPETAEEWLDEQQAYDEMEPEENWEDETPPPAAPAPATDHPPAIAHEPAPAPPPEPAPREAPAASQEKSGPAA